MKRRMYELCADGLGGRKIAAVLAAEGVRSRAGKPFSGTDIIRMVRNPMNKGTVVMNKKHYDFNTGKTLLHRRAGSTSMRENSCYRL